MLQEFLVWCAANMDRKGEEFSANHTRELLAMVEGMSQEEGMARMEKELEFLKHAMKLEMREHGNTVNHGTLWTKMLNVEQALKAGAGKLFWG